MIDPVLVPSASASNLIVSLQPDGSVPMVALSWLVVDVDVDTPVAQLAGFVTTILSKLSNPVGRVSFTVTS